MSCPQPLYSSERTHYPLNRRLVDPRAGLGDFLEKRKSIVPIPTEPRFKWADNIKVDLKIWDWRV
jgi:hypothetical protein